MTNYELLVQAHRKVEGRDVNEIARLFTLCQLNGMNLKPWEFLGPVKPIERVWNTKAE